MPVKDKKAYRQYMRDYRKNKQTAEQKQRARDRIKRRQKELRVWFKEYKSHLKCSRCPEDFWACLEFHHKNSDNKEIILSRVAENGWSIERIKKEIAKCEVLCANCHRKEHFI